MHRQQEARPRAHPRIPVEREAAARDDAVGVGMEVKIPRPGVQDRRHAEHDRAAEPSRIAPEDRERASGALQQQVEDERAVAPRELAQLGRQSEHHMEVVDGQDAVEARLQPARPAHGLALGAVAIAARVVRRALVPARRAHVDVAAERSRATEHHIAGDAGLTRAERVRAHVRGQGAPKDVGDLQSRPVASRRFARFARSTVGVLGHCSPSAEDLSARRPDQVEGTWHLAQAGRGQVQVLGRAPDGRVAEQHLHRAHVGACLQ